METPARVGSWRKIR